MCDKIPFFTFFESFVPPRDLGLLPTTPAWWAAAWTGRSAPWSWS
ncbi:MAG: hypothetical protein ACLR5H_00315 [Oscillospiraceae bacterium]